MLGDKRDKAFLIIFLLAVYGTFSLVAWADYQRSVRIPSHGEVKFEVTFSRYKQQLEDLGILVVWKAEYDSKTAYVYSTTNFNEFLQKLHTYNISVVATNHEPLRYPDYPMNPKTLYTKSYLMWFGFPFLDGYLIIEFQGTDYWYLKGSG